MSQNSWVQFLIWLKEKCFGPSSEYTKPMVKTMLAQPLAKFHGKTLWHLVSDLSFGAKLLSEIVGLPQAQREEASIVTKVIGNLPRWSFGEFFELAVDYQGDNPLTYAIKRNNINVVRIMLENILKDEKKFSSEILQSFFAAFFKGYPQAMVFCEKLANEIEAATPKSAMMAMFNSAIALLVTKPLPFAVMAALVMRLFKEGTIPVDKKDLEAFLVELREDPSKYIHLPLLKNISTPRLAKMAANVSSGITMAANLSVPQLAPAILARQVEPLQLMAEQQLVIIEEDEQYALKKIIPYYSHSQAALKRSLPEEVASNQSALAASAKLSTKRAGLKSIIVIDD